MEVHDIVVQARDALTVKRVFGEPYEKDGMTIISRPESRAVQAQAAARIRRTRARASRMPRTWIRIRHRFRVLGSPSRTRPEARRVRKKQR